MIRVAPAAAPTDFDAKVRQPGLRKIAMKLGQKVPGGGRRPRTTYLRIEDIPAKKFPPEWRHCLDDLMAAYRQICAYTSLYIEDGTGDRTVDHWTPIDADRHGAYEWSNYRLACGLVNSAKGTRAALDPFCIKDHWFELELVGYQVVPGARTKDPLRGLIWTNIEDILDLNNARHCRQRSEHAGSYLQGEVPWSRLERHAPFVARELRRHGKLRPDDRMSFAADAVPESDLDYAEILRRRGANLGDEDFALCKCPRCARVYLLEHEADTLYLDPADLTRRVDLTSGATFRCEGCDHPFPIGTAWIGARAPAAMQVTWSDLRASPWSWITATTR